MLYSSLGFNKSIKSCVHHWSITQNSFPALKSSALTCSFFPLPQPLAATDLYCLYSWPFPECHIVEIMVNSFLDTLISLSNMHFTFLSCLFVTWQSVPFSLGKQHTTGACQFVHLLIYQRTSWFLQVTNKTATDIHMQALVWTSHFSKYLGVQLLECMVRVC